MRHVERSDGLTGKKRNLCRSSDQFWPVSDRRVRRSRLVRLPYIFISLYVKTRQSPTSTQRLSIWRGSDTPLT